MSTHNDDPKHPETPTPITPAEANLLQCIRDIEPEALHEALKFVFTTALFNSTISLNASEKEDLHRVQELMDIVKKM
jgi:hypothetical protein